MVVTLPWAHIAAPTRLEIMKTSPIMGSPSNRAAVNPNAVTEAAQEGFTQQIHLRLTSIIPLPFLDEDSHLLLCHLLRLEVL
jgi:hypothetical protein